MDETRTDLEARLLRLVEEKGGWRSELSPAYLAAVEEIEELECNRSGQDKSWILRSEQRERAYFASVRRIDPKTGREWRPSE